MRKAIVSATVAASVLGGAAGAVVFAPGLAGAQDGDDTSGTPTEEPTPGVSAAETAGRADWVRDTLDGLVADGTLDEAQADAVYDALDAARPDLGHRGPGGPGGPDGQRDPGMGPKGGLDALTELLGLDADELRTALADGQTLAEVAEAQGVDRQTLIDAIVADASARLDDAVADGRIDRTQADERLAEITERAGAMVDGELPPGGGGPGMGGPGRGGPGGHHHD